MKGQAFVRFAGELVSVFVHWAYARTLPCLGRGCPHCREGTPSRWSGYAAALHWLGKSVEHPAGKWNPVVLHVPAGNREDLDGPITGEVFAVERVPVKGSTALKFTRQERPAGPLNAPSIDVKAVLMKLWRYGTDEAAAWAFDAEHAPPPDARVDDTPAATIPFPRRKKGGA